MKFERIGGGVGYKKQNILDRAIRKQLIEAGYSEKEMDMAYDAIQGLKKVEAPIAIRQAQAPVAEGAQRPVDPFDDAKFQNFSGSWANGVYTPPKDVLRETAIAGVRRPRYTLQQNPVTTWAVMSGDKLNTLHGRVESSLSKKAAPKVKFVRSGKRWGVIIG